jgi:hypothetical protein
MKPFVETNAFTVTKANGLHKKAMESIQWLSGLLDCFALIRIGEKML